MRDHLHYATMAALTAALCIGAIPIAHGPLLVANLTMATFSALSIPILLAMAQERRTSP